MARICVIRQGPYPLDPRPRRQVEALAAAGHTVDVICQPFGQEAARERQGRIRIRRFLAPRTRDGLAARALEHAAFLVLAAALLTVRHLRRPYDLVQVHTVPDTLVLAALPLRVLGTPVLLDLQECSPEFFASTLRLSQRHPAIRLVALVEQLCIRLATRAMTCTRLMRAAFVERGAPEWKIDVILDSADETIFDPSRHPPVSRDPDCFVLMCHGTIEERYGIDTIIRAVERLRGDIPGLRLEVYGHGSYLEELRRLVTDLGVERHVHFAGTFVPLRELTRAIAAADAGVVAMKRDPFRDLTLCCKMYDFITMRKPVVMSRTRSIDEYFGDSCFQMFESDDVDDLSRAILELYNDSALAATLVHNASRVIEPLRWPHQRAHYLAIVEDLLGRDPLRRRKSVA